MRILHYENIHSFVNLDRHLINRQKNKVTY